MQTYQTYEQTIEAMTIPFKITIKTILHPISTTDWTKLIQKIHSELILSEKKISTFKSNSLVSKFNNGQEYLLVQDQELQTIFAKSMIAYQETSHYFDPWFDGTFNPTGLTKGWIIQKIFNQYLRPFSYIHLIFYLICQEYKIKILIIVDIKLIIKFTDKR